MIVTEETPVCQRGLSKSGDDDLKMLLAAAKHQSPRFYLEDESDLGSEELPDVVAPVESVIKVTLAVESKATLRSTGDAELDALLEELNNPVEVVRHSPSINPTTGKNDCFGNRNDYTPKTEPKQCGHCLFGSNDCRQAGQRRRLELSRAAVPLVPDPAICTLPAPEPVPEVAIESPAPTPATSVDLFSSQRFTAALIEAHDTDASALLEQLASASEAIFPIDAATNYSDELRVQLCVADHALNTKGVMPVFREVRHGRFTKQGQPVSDSDALLSNDLRVADLDWLAKHHPTGRGKEFDRLLNDDGTLNYARARAFVSRKGKAEEKARLLHLTPQIETELRMLKPSAASAHWSRLKKDKHRDIAKIVTAIDRGHGRKGGDPEQLWRLYVLCAMNGWRASHVIDSATRLPENTATPARIRKDIDWLKSIGLEPA